MISPTGDKMFPVLEGLLTWTSKRQQVLSDNVANLDTPGYRARDFSFAEQLSALAMTTTSASHITPLEDTASAHVYEVDGQEKPNGNNVDLERETTEITRNGVQYTTLVQYLNQKIKTLRSAIDGGKG
jgi:flagellar basal-body rod protein FlgB